MVDRHVEETLELVRMEVHGHDPVDAGCNEQVGHQFGAYGCPGLVLAVLSGISEIRDHGHDLVGGGSFCRVDQQQEFEYIFRGREGGLDDEDRTAPDRFFVIGLEFPVAEFKDIGFSQLAAERFGNFLGQVPGLGASEEFNG